MRGSVKRLMKIAKKEVGRGTYEKLSSIQNEEDLENALKYILAHTLEHKTDILDKKIKYLKQYKKNVFFAETKHILLKNKMAHFKATFNDEDYKKLNKVLKDVTMEITNV